MRNLKKNKLVLMLLVALFALSTMAGATFAEGTADIENPEMTIVEVQQELAGETEKDEEIVIVIEEPAEVIEPVEQQQEQTKPETTPEIKEEEEKEEEKEEETQLVPGKGTDPTNNTNKDKENEKEQTQEKTYYTVSFEALDGTEYEILREQVQEGNRASKPFADPILDGYNFLYWVDKDDLSEFNMEASMEMLKADVEYEGFDFDLSYIYHNTVLVAAFEKIEEPVIVETENNNSENDNEEAANNEQQSESSKENANKENESDLLLGDLFSDKEKEGVVVDVKKEGDLVVAIIDVPATIEQTEVPQGTVEVTSNRSGIIMAGETISLQGIVDGFEGATLSFQWETNAGDGWETVQGATEQTYEFVADETNVNNVWRLMVKVEAVETPVEAAPTMPMDAVEETETDDIQG